MIRVAQIMGQMNGGGVESVVMNYYRHIDRTQIQFDFIVASNSNCIPREEIDSLGGRIIEVPPYQQLPNYMATLKTLFSSREYTIVHSHVNALSVFPLYAAKQALVPVRIAHSHSTDSSKEPWKSLVKRVLRTQANRFPTQKVACSRYAGEWLFGKGSSFLILNNAIELSNFKYNPVIRKEVRAELGLSHDQFAIGHIGRFMKQKNHEFLLEVFSKVAEQSSKAKLILVGMGPELERIKSSVIDSGLKNNVVFLGQRDDISRLYQAFDVFVLPSLYEGLPVVAVEAQSAGLPCFVSDSVTREAGITKRCSFLSLHDGAQKWAAEILGAFGERDSDLSLDDQCRLKSFDIEHTAPMLQAWYMELLDSVSAISK